MIDVLCCMCNKLVMRKPGYANGTSHGFCQHCLDEYCKESGVDPIEISVPEGAIINEEAFHKRQVVGVR